MKPVRSALLLAAAFCALAATPLQDPTYTLRWKPTEGQKLDYGMAVKMSMEGVSIEILSDLSATVKKVAENGNYTVETRASNMRMISEGEEHKMGDEDEVETTEYDAKGEEIPKADKKEEEEEDDELSSLMKALGAFTSPEKPVKKGDKWTQKIKADEKKKVKAADVDYEVVGEEKIGAYSVVKVSMKYRQTAEVKPTTYSGFMAFELKDMSLVKIEADVQDAPLDEETRGPVKFEMTRK